MATRGPIPKRPRSVAVTHRPEQPVSYIAPVDGPPEPPDSLGPVGQDAWNRWWKSATWLVESDAFGLLIAAQILDALEDIRLRVEADGRVTEGSKGQPVAHPLLQEQRSLTSLLIGFLGDYGLTPAGRRRLGIEVRAEPVPRLLDRYTDPYAHLRTDA